MPIAAPKTILIVDDEPEIITALTHYLSSEGFTVKSAQNGTEMIEHLINSDVDLVLLDLGLQNESGLDLLKNEVVDRNVAVVILTGNSDPIERVVGLELGADDYVVKPFLKRELLARINAVLRRTSSHLSIENFPSREKPRCIHVNKWLIDMQKRQVQMENGSRVDLTGIEFDLLVALANNVGETMSRDQLSWSALNREWVPNDRSVDIHIHNLRKKMSDGEAEQDPIITVRNVGYALAAEVISK